MSPFWATVPAFSAASGLVQASWTSLAAGAKGACEGVEDEHDLADPENSLDGGMIATVGHEEPDAVGHAFHLRIIQDWRKP